MENQKCKDAVAKAKEFFSKKNYFWTKVAAIVLAVIILLIILILCLTLCTRHKHTYSDEWSYDETYHYHAATCEHEDEVADKAAHSFLYAKCTVCSYSIESNTEVQIAEGTTTIGTNAYINMDQIGFVVIPETVEEIEENAFPETVIIYIKGEVRDFEYPDDNMYFYSEEKPTDDTKNYWHYVDGEIKSWHEHTIVSVSGTSATCTANGTSAHYKCTECGKLFSDEAGTTEVTLASLTISAHHTLNKTDKVNATCTADGRQEYYTCSVCNKIFGDSTGTTETTLDNLKINKLGHNMTHHAESSSTCATKGNTEYWSCDRCGKYFSNSTGTTEITDKTSVEKSTVAHTIVSVSATPETCTANGTSAHYKCSVCGKLFSDETGTTEVTLASLTISAHHTLNKTDKVNAGCETDGCQEYYTCSVCNKIFSDSTGTTETTLANLKINKTGHTLNKTDKVNATCTADGRQEYYTCSVCNKIFGDSTGTTETTLDNLKINKLGHDMTHHAKVAATSTTTGTIEYWSCNRCGKNFSDEDGTTEVTTLTIPIVTNYKYVEGSTTAIYFGSYPQTQVTDTDLRNTLTEKAGTLPTSGSPQKWTDYGYYKSNSVSSYMFYIDIDNDSDGDYDYRGVYFTGYRPYSTATDPTFNEPQRLNAYYPNTVYWFKYEPIKWNILKTENNKALIISDLLLDSQDYNYTKNSRTNVSDYQDNTSTGTIYSNNYMYSHIRSWLNTTFYNTAFSDLEKQIIETTVVDNSVESTASTSNSYACSNTSDNMFLLSSKEATTYYSSNSERIAQGSDYAKCQGLSVNTSSGNSNYWLRSPRSDNESRTNDININGGISYLDTNQTQFGVRAACWINL